MYLYRDGEHLQGLGRMITICTAIFKEKNIYPVGQSHLIRLQ